MTWIQLRGEGLGVRVFSSADRRREVQQQKRSEKPVGALEGRANRWTERKASGEKLPKKEKSVSDLSVLQDGVPRESPLTCLNSVCVSGLSEAQFRGGSHPCISVTLGKSPPPQEIRVSGHSGQRCRALGRWNQCHARLSWHVVLADEASGPEPEGRWTPLPTVWEAQMGDIRVGWRELGLCQS